MKIASWKLVLATTLLAIVGVQSVPTPPTDGFTPEEQSIWIDHHNFFRMTALPYSAANMLRMKWNADLATQAAAEAKACTIISKPGVNLHVCQSNETKALIDHTFTNWAVKPALASVKSLKPPRAGDPVGVGVYNSYSQIVWSSSCEVGCARVSCGDGTTGVACKYSVPGNDGTSPWYTHGEPASACPAGTTPKVGLCVKADADYGIPTPETSKAQYVFKDFIPEVQKLLTGQAAPAKIGTAETTDDTTAGKVKPYDASAEHRGSVPSPATPSTPDQPTPAPAPTPIPGTEVTTPAAEPTPASPNQADTPSGATPASVVSVANNKSEQNVSAGGFSAAGLAGCVVLGLFFVAGVAVFVSYRRNQKRQRDIMQNGGIHIL